MGDLLKEAIADAKAVRETALQNAKMALEEAFTPQLKSMLSAKLKEDEFGDEEEVPAEEQDEFGDEEEFGGEEEVPAEEGDYSEQDEFGGEEGGEEEMPAEVPTEEVPTEEDEFGGEEGGGEEEEGDLDLEAIIRELETELKEEDEAYDDSASSEDKNGGNGELAEEDDAYDENASPEKNGLAEQDDDEEVEVDESIFFEEEDEEEVAEQSDSSGIGNGENSVNSADGSDEEDPGNGDVHEQLKEYKEAVRFLKNKLHEVNILNAKLLFTNKLFKEYSLNNNQKLKVVETFDRTQTTREIKLVYSTLAEQFGDNGSIKRKYSINESASKAVSSTKPSRKSRKVITEETKVANRFKKLAGII